ncbi:hypothetical protein P171DRAFT_30038 [Karstenula rhodostoma CBS 690.94]|uniref:Uncharacterized protein n=1 Tax=Karstenula rhodostoma CBS 690.94 TaxID=1392251 RepID=A0A9P4PHK1_9PLEO|nr:hypothetical protein P171DRAFT_30038 [Karstenula rhodostoma CBS 690.94]
MRDCPFLGRTWTGSSTSQGLHFERFSTSHHRVYAHLLRTNISNTRSRSTNSQSSTCPHPSRYQACNITTHLSTHQSTAPIRHCSRALASAREPNCHLSVHRMRHASHTNLMEFQDMFPIVCTYAPRTLPASIASDKCHMHTSLPCSPSTRGPLPHFPPSASLIPTTHRVDHVPNLNVFVAQQNSQAVKRTHAESSTCFLPWPLARSSRR